MSLYSSLQCIYPHWLLVHVRCISFDHLVTRNTERPYVSLQLNAVTTQCVAT